MAGAKKIFVSLVLITILFSLIYPIGGSDVRQVPKITMFQSDPGVVKAYVSAFVGGEYTTITPINADDWVDGDISAICQEVACVDQDGDGVLDGYYQTGTQRSLENAKIYFQYWDIETGTKMDVSSCSPLVANLTEDVPTPDGGVEQIFYVECVVPEELYINSPTKCVSIRSEFRGGEFYGEYVHEAYSTFAVSVCEPGTSIFSSLTDNIAAIIALQAQENSGLCILAFIVLGTLFASMYYSGRNPLSLLDITSPKLPGPKAMAASGTVLAPMSYGRMKSGIKETNRALAGFYGKYLAGKGSIKAIDAMFAAKLGIGKGLPTTAASFMGTGALQDAMDKRRAKKKSDAHAYLKFLAYRAYERAQQNGEDPNAAAAEVLNTYQNGRVNLSDLRAILNRFIEGGDPLDETYARMVELSVMGQEQMSQMGVFGGGTGFDRESMLSRATGGVLKHPVHTGMSKVLGLVGHAPLLGQWLKSSYGNFRGSLRYARLTSSALLASAVSLVTLPIGGQRTRRVIARGARGLSGAIESAQESVGTGGKILMTPLGALRVVADTADSILTKTDDTQLYIGRRGRTDRQMERHYESLAMLALEDIEVHALRQMLLGMGVDEDLVARIDVRRIGNFQELAAMISAMGGDPSLVSSLRDFEIQLSQAILGIDRTRLTVGDEVEYRIERARVILDAAGVGGDAAASLLGIEAIHGSGRGALRLFDMEDHLRIHAGDVGMGFYHLAGRTETWYEENGVYTTDLVNRNLFRLFLANIESGSLEHTPDNESVFVNSAKGNYLRMANEMHSLYYLYAPAGDTPQEIRETMQTCRQYISELTTDSGRDFLRQFVLQYDGVRNADGHDILQTLVGGLGGRALDEFNTRFGRGDLNSAVEVLTPLLLFDLELVGRKEREGLYLTPWEHGPKDGWHKVGMKNFWNIGYAGGEAALERSVDFGVNKMFHGGYFSPDYHRFEDRINVLENAGQTVTQDDRLQLYRLGFLTDRMENRLLEDNINAFGREYDNHSRYLRTVFAEALRRYARNGHYDDDGEQHRTQECNQLRSLVQGQSTDEIIRLLRTGQIDESLVRDFTTNYLERRVVYAEQKGGVLARTNDGGIIAVNEEVPLSNMDIVLNGAVVYRDENGQYRKFKAKDAAQGPIAVLNDEITLLGGRNGGNNAMVQHLESELHNLMGTQTGAGATKSRADWAPYLDYVETQVRAGVVSSRYLIALSHTYAKTTGDWSRLMGATDSNNNRLCRLVSNHELVTGRDTAWDNIKLLGIRALEIPFSSWVRRYASRGAWEVGHGIERNLLATFGENSIAMDAMNQVSTLFRFRSEQLAARILGTQGPHNPYVDDEHRDYFEHFARRALRYAPGWDLTIDRHPAASDTGTGRTLFMATGYHLGPYIFDNPSRMGAYFSRSQSAGVYLHNKLMDPMRGFMRPLIRGYRFFKMATEGAPTNFDITGDAMSNWNMLGGRRYFEAGRVLFNFFGHQREMVERGALTGDRSGRPITPAQEFGQQFRTGVSYVAATWNANPASTYYDANATLRYDPRTASQLTELQYQGINQFYAGDTELRRQAGLSIVRRQVGSVLHAVERGTENFHDGFTGGAAMRRASAIALPIVLPLKIGWWGAKKITQFGGASLGTYRHMSSANDGIVKKGFKAAVSPFVVAGTGVGRTAQSAYRGTRRMADQTIFGGRMIDYTKCSTCGQTMRRNSICPNTSCRSRKGGQPSNGRNWSRAA